MARLLQSVEQTLWNNHSVSVFVTFLFTAINQHFFLVFPHLFGFHIIWFLSRCDFLAVLLFSIVEITILLIPASVNSQSFVLHHMEVT